MYKQKGYRPFAVSWLAGELVNWFKNTRRKRNVGAYSDTPLPLAACNYF